MRSQSSMPILQDRTPLSEPDTTVAGLLALLQNRGQRHALSAGAPLFAEDDPIDRVFVLASGWALKSKSLIDGRRQLLDFALPGDLLGSLRRSRASHAAEMLTAGEVVAVPVDLFVSMATGKPQLAIEIARQMEAAELRAYERIAAIGCRSAHLRVCRLLTELVTRQLRPSQSEYALRLMLPLRQIHIADALGLRIETVCRVLGRLARTGIAHLRAGELVVADLDALRRESELESPPPAGKLIDLRAVAALHVARLPVARLSVP